MKSIFHAEINGASALVFNTGLDGKAFAQTKSAQIITLPGWAVSADGAVELWKLEGVAERDGRMVLWGRDFAGEPLSELIDCDARKDFGLDALRRWIAARLILSETKSVESAPAPYPIGAFIRGDGTILFPPEPLIRQAVSAESSDLWRAAAERWAHPDLTGLEASLFTAGAMAYRIFAGSPPFPNSDIDALRQDIREGVFFPLRFAAPGLDSGLAELITDALEQCTKKKPDREKTVTLRMLADRLGAAGSAPAESYIRVLSPAEQAKVSAELERFRKKQRVTVQTKRFAVRNAAILGAVFAGLIAVGLAAHSIAVAKASRPTTKGMTPIEVAETYYTAIGDLDHTLMEACVSGKAGKGDIEMVINYFVLSKVRQAYEMGGERVISARKWLDAGSPSVEETGTAVFGVTDLRLTPLDADGRDGEVSFQSEYRLWHPEAQGDSDTIVSPQYTQIRDTIKLGMLKGNWRIIAIERKTE
ncbi:MAG: hypothetical protein LBG87_04165 [Spirochaetaceae bacterium]|jgi:hypothetical protein|nr:hypothetical protein [Spirochaetaceae bacterium]